MCWTKILCGDNQIQTPREENSHKTLSGMSKQRKIQRKHKDKSEVDLKAGLGFFHRNGLSTN